MNLPLLATVGLSAISRPSAGLQVLPVDELSIWKLQ